MNIIGYFCEFLSPIKKVPKKTSLLREKSGFLGYYRTLVHVQEVIQRQKGIRGVIEESNLSELYTEMQDGFGGKTSRLYAV